MSLWTRLFIGSACVMISVGTPREARSEGGKEPTPKKVALAYPSGYRVYHDGHGHYLVLGKATSPKAWREVINGSKIYFGTRKVLYRQSARGFSRTRRGIELTIRDPRARSNLYSAFDLRVDGTAFFRCERRETGLSELSADEARQFLKKATFRDVYWNHVSHFLARDDDGRYFYADRLREHRRFKVSLRLPRFVAPRGVRLWIGKRGKMKRIKLRDIVADPAGQILIWDRGKVFLTKKGRGFAKIEWKKKAGRGEKPTQRIPLTIVRLGSATGAAQFIYFDLGPYSGVSLHKPCDVW